MTLPSHSCATETERTVDPTRPLSGLTEAQAWAVDDLIMQVENTERLYLAMIEVAKRIKIKLNDGFAIQLRTGAWPRHWFRQVIDQAAFDYHRTIGTPQHPFTPPVAQAACEELCRLTVERIQCGDYDWIGQPPESATA